MKAPLTTAALIAVACLVGSATAQVSPIDATGWNHDLVINHPSPYNLSITGTMDGGNYTVWDGTVGVPDTFVEGLVAGTHSSLTGNGTFAFQDFSGNNVIGLDGGQSGVLTLTNPAAYKSIALYGASGFGAKTADILLTFSDASTTLFQITADQELKGIATDWFNSAADKAYEVKGRASNKSEEGYTILFYQQKDVIGIKESLLNLSAADQAKLLTSVSITNTGGDRMAVFALSGQPVPEPTTVGLLGLGSICVLAGRRRRA